MQIIKQILSFLLLLILQISFANSFASGFSNEELCVFSIENSEKPNSDFLEADFEENNIFESSFLDIVSCPSVSCCGAYTDLVESWKVVKDFSGIVSRDVDILNLLSKNENLTNICNLFKNGNRTKLYSSLTEFDEAIIYHYTKYSSAPLHLAVYNRDGRMKKSL